MGARLDWHHFHTTAWDGVCAIGRIKGRPTATSTPNGASASFAMASSKGCYQNRGIKLAHSRSGPHRRPSRIRTRRRLHADLQPIPSNPAKWSRQASARGCVARNGFRIQARQWKRKHKNVKHSLPSTWRSSPIRDRLDGSLERPLQHASWPLGRSTA
jgi:hypothetical protein